MGVEIAGRILDKSHPCFVIAEAGSNHGGDFDAAIRLVQLAADCQADAVKFQSFSADGLAVKYLFDEKGDRRPNPVYAALERFALPLDWHMLLKEEAERLGLVFLSTPFDEKRLDLLLELDVAAIKIASGDLTHIEFIARAARSDKPILLSTGMATCDEIRRAVECVYSAGNRQLIVLHCVTRYPSDLWQMNLRVLESRFGFDELEAPLGLSDHSPGIETALAARALGACVIEKHLTPSREQPTPDAPFALEPDEFREMVNGLRKVEAALGSDEKQLIEGEAEERQVGRRSICAAMDIPCGTMLEREMVKFRRPGTGFEPSALERILSRRARRDIRQDELLSEEMFV